MMAGSARKSTQRERLVMGMVQVANRGGYAAANVSNVIERAGVSRPTFYDYFADRDDCFVAAIADIQQELGEAVRAAASQAPAQEAAVAGVEAIVTFASSHPARARFLMSEAMAGGPRALDTRDEGIAQLAAIIAEAERAATAATLAPDLPLEAVVGGIYRMLATRLRRGEPAISRIADELLAWIAGYRTPVGEHRWHTLAPASPAPPSPHVPDVQIQHMPGVLGPGRPRISEEEVAEIHRLRILFAVAKLAESKGYTATTIADITKLARVHGSVFYRMFSSKQDAFMAAHEVGVQQVMRVTSGAFFSGETWPERSWEGGRALTQLVEANPLVAHVGFVEAYAVGPGAVQRVEDSHTAFTFFLQEGLVYRDQEHPPSHVAMETIVTSIFEIIYLQARRAGPPVVSPMLPVIEHLWLTPFLGPADADRFIDRRLKGDERRS